MQCIQKEGNPCPNHQLKMTTAFTEILVGNWRQREASQTLVLPLGPNLTKKPMGALSLPVHYSWYENKKLLFSFGRKRKSSSKITQLQVSKPQNVTLDFLQRKETKVFSCRSDCAFLGLLLPSRDSWCKPFSFLVIQTIDFSFITKLLLKNKCSAH